MTQEPHRVESQGVDVRQIRRQLQMSVEERVRHMVDVANTLINVRASSHFIDPPVRR